MESLEMLTANEALAVGAIIGTFIALFLIIIFITWALTIIATWKIFKKAKEPGWKSLIPIYNTYTLYKIIGLSFWKWLIIPALIIGLLSGVSGYITGLSSDYEVIGAIPTLIGCAIEVIILTKFAYYFAKAYGKGKWFAAGLFFFPTLFQLILGFGSAKYVKPKK